jgi:hypothetical protein
MSTSSDDELDDIRFQEAYGARLFRLGKPRVLLEVKTPNIPSTLYEARWLQTLPMWRAYGSNYAGIAIDFRATSMIGILARLQKVQYVDEKHRQGFRNIGSRSC